MEGSKDIYKGSYLSSNIAPKLFCSYVKEFSIHTFAMFTYLHILTYLLYRLNQKSVISTINMRIQVNQWHLTWVMTNIWRICMGDGSKAIWHCKPRQHMTFYESWGEGNCGAGTTGTYEEHWNSVGLLVIGTWETWKIAWV